MDERRVADTDRLCLTPAAHRAVEDVVRDIGFPLEPETMFPRILDAALALTRADAGSLALVDEETRLLQIPVTKGFSEQTVRNLKIGVGEGVIGWVVQNDRPYIVPDTHAEPRFIAGDIDVRSEMAVPMRLGDRVIGALDVNTFRPNAFHEDDAAVLLEFATAMAPRVQNARLFGETRQRAEALHALFEIGKLVSQTLDLNRLLERIVQHAVRIMDARIVALTLLDAEKDELVTSAVAGASRAYASKPPLPVGRSLIGNVVLTKQPVIVEDVQKDPRYRFMDIAREEGLRSLLAVPLMFRERVSGVLSIYKGHIHIFRREEIHITMSLADQAAIAIRNARLYERILSLEEHVRRMEKAGTAGEIAIGLAHEIRNPLTVVKMLFEPQAPLNAEDHDVIRSEVNRMATIVEQYLGFARGDGGEWGSVALEDVAWKALRLLEHRASRQEIEVVTQFPPVPLVVTGNASELEQVFVNLFLNAMDAMPEGGTLTVAFEIDGPTARVQVRDTGSGIPPSVQARLFEPFNTSKPTGIGLGLSIVRRIIGDHQGRIVAANLPNAGACFTMEFPLSAADGEARYPETRRHKAAKAG
jgi:signal transduction histidine kinase